MQFQDLVIEEEINVEAGTASFWANDLDMRFVVGFSYSAKVQTDYNGGNFGLGYEQQSYQTLDVSLEVSSVRIETEEGEHVGNYKGFSLPKISGIVRQIYDAIEETELAA